MRDYERLKSGGIEFGKLDAVVEVPRPLIWARIVRGLGQKSLTVRLGLKDQRIQRYEVSEYASASLARVGNCGDVSEQFKPVCFSRPRETTRALDFCAELIATGASFSIKTKFRNILIENGH